MAPGGTLYTIQWLERQVISLLLLFYSYLILKSQNKSLDKIYFVSDFINNFF